MGFDCPSTSAEELVICELVSSCSAHKDSFAVYAARQAPGNSLTTAKEVTIHLCCALFLVILVPDLFLEQFHITLKPIHRVHRGNLVA